MKPLSLKLSNFQSHRDTVLDLSSIDCAVLSGPNGAGKSSLLDAMLFALFGETRGGNLDSVITHGEEVARVEFEFSMNGSRYLVSRQRSRKGAGTTTLTFQCDGQLLDGKTATETQRRIEEVTGLTADLLRATAVSAQGDADAFARAKATERKGYLGSILQLEHYDRLAQEARDQAKAAQGERDAKQSALEAAQATAATIPTIQEQLTAAAGNITGLEKARDETQESLDGFTRQREETSSAQAADTERRKALANLAEQIGKAKTVFETAERKANHLSFTADGKPAAVTGLEAAKAAQAKAEGFEAKRQERERLKSEGLLLSERVKASRAAHQQSIKERETEIATAKREHEREAATLRETIEELEKREKLLEGVPCTDTPMAETCPLIVDAMSARTLLPTKQQELQTLEQQTPWQDKERKLEETRLYEPWSADETESKRLKAAYDAIEYDAEAHQKAKAEAAKLSDRQKLLAGIEAAEQQLPEAQQAVTTAQNELSALERQHKELSEQLGDATDWAARLAAIEERLKSKREDLGRISRSLDVARQQQGALTERLEAAQQAAAQVAVLEADLHVLELRLLHLKMLGNPRDGAFSRAGIPALLIDQAIPELQDAANAVLETLSDGRLALELRTQGETRSGSTTETLDLVVFDDAGGRLLESYSGGEQMRVHLALRVGLSKLLAHRAGAKCQLLVLDEMAAPLDVRGQEQFVEALATIAEEEDLTVLCVSHLADLKEAFPVRIEVSRNGRGSSIEVTHA
ncbi:MAG: SMC family ATPase [Anaerolineae bacterium]|nr:SMC family ATPase [Anaerolineae bacterium]